MSTPLHSILHNHFRKDSRSCIPVPRPHSEQIQTGVGPVWNNSPVTPTAGSHHDWFLVACAAGTVLLLLIMIAKVRLHPALALMIGALGLGVASGMPLTKVPLAFTAGVANMMGHIAIILGLGAILGCLVARSGGAASLSKFLIDNCGEKGLPWALLILGIVVGMPVFFEVGLVLLMPIVVEAARRTNRPPILAGMPLLAGLSIVHGTLPPHPAALLAATEYHADLGRTILWGLAAGLPAAAIAGPGLGWLMIRNWERKRAKAGVTEQYVVEAVFAPATAGVESAQNTDSEALPREPISSFEKVPAPAGPIRAAIAVLLPIALICLGSWADSIAAPGGILNQILHFVGSADIALLIAVLSALLMLGPRIQTGRHHGRELLRQLAAESFEPIANVLVILAAAGGLSGVLRDSGAAQATVGLALGAHMPPLVLAWTLAAVVRISMGSATVAMAVAAGVLAPIAGHAGVRPELLVLATGTGSLILSHVNDPGFWMVQSFFKMDLKKTLSTWSVMETVVSVAGLGTTLLLAAVLG
jgi:gluconate:H+ symporter, GntP family